MFLYKLQGVSQKKAIIRSEAKSLFIIWLDVSLRETHLLQNDIFGFLDNPYRDLPIMVNVLFHHLSIEHIDSLHRAIR